MIRPLRARFPARSLAVALGIAVAAGAAYADTFTYRGYLEDGGSPAEGRYDLQLSLYADAEGARSLGVPIELTDVTLRGGHFAVAVPMPALPAQTDAAWLGVAVKSAYDGSFWPLSEKSRVSLAGECPAAWALDGNAGTNAATHFVGTTDETPLVLRSGATGGVLRAYPSGDVDIDVPGAIQMLKVSANSGSLAKTIARFDNVGVGGARIEVRGGESANHVGYDMYAAGSHLGRLFGLPSGLVALRSNADLALRTGDNLTRMFLTADGNVGVGTTSPQAGLHVQRKVGTTDPLVRFQSDELFAPANVEIRNAGSGSFGIEFGRVDGTSLGTLHAHPADGAMSMHSPGEVGISAGVGLTGKSVRAFANRGVGINRGLPSVGFAIHVGSNTTNGNGAHLTNGGSWTNGSSRTFKHSFSPVDGPDVLAKVLALPIATWSYHDADAIRHMGPVAEDFHAAFKLGDDEKYIGTVDADGVALAAIQGLNAKLEAGHADLRNELAALRQSKDAEVSALREELAAVRQAQDSELLALRAELAVMRDLLMPAVAHGGR